tara:strand:+ start:105 stop:437 length:333 start_codon:yes stop_codon:yes gene_type:complete
MKKNNFIINSERAKKINSIFKKEKINLSHIIVLSEILLRKINNEQLPNVKWVQSELEISFTKLKAILDFLENNQYIIKTNDSNDKRVKFLEITKKGEQFIVNIFGVLPLN